MPFVNEYLLYETPIMKVRLSEKSKLVALNTSNLLLIGYSGKLYDCRIVRRTDLSLGLGGPETLLRNLRGGMVTVLHTEDPQAEIRERVWEVLPMKLVEYYK